MKRLVVAAVALLPVTAQAQAFRCQFPQPSGTPLELVFAAFDTNAGTAQLIGNAGTSTVEMRQGTNAISFVEIVGSGAVMSTTVSIAAASPFQAIHSRNTLIAEQFVPSQTIGQCTYLN